ncbi:MAG: hypothetical protein K8S62_14870 [Candidatus Sabulitectum sp.]|nr:hypothetical protein [Candidatus Sabulitectum sp.]
MARQLDCPSCGASVKARRGVASVTCQYCGSSVIVPPDIAGPFRGSGSAAMQGKSCGKSLVIAVALAVFLLVGIGSFIFYLTMKVKDEVMKIPDSFSIPVESNLTVMEFGGTGTGPGCFLNPHCIAIDGSSNIYVGECETGRVQVFDRNGTFIHQWSFAENGEIYLSVMSASRDGILYMVYDSELYVHDGETGELIDSLQHPDGWGFQDVDVASDGSILASWYCNRDDIIRFDCNGEVDLFVEDAISGQTGDSELSTIVAAGNLGEIYAFGSFNEAVLTFNSQGHFQDRFGSDEIFTMPFGIAVDPLGRLWMSDFDELLLFNSSGELINRINPGRSVYDFVIDDNMQLFGITMEDMVVQIDLSII